MHRSLGRGVAVGALATVLVVPLASANANANVNAHATAGVRSAPQAQEQAAFGRAASDFRVPESLLLAVSYALTGWESHGGQVSTAGGYGPMHLVDLAGAGDARGDASRPPRLAASPLQRGAGLAGVADATVRSDRQGNIRAGAALIADNARRLGGGRLPSTLGGWYPAVARYSGSSDTLGAQQFADDVYATIRSGASATTSDRQSMHLAAQPGIRADKSGLARLHLLAAPAVRAAECPTGLDCRYIPAAYAQNTPGDPSDYGNYDMAKRPGNLKISYVVIHDTEVRYNPTIALFQDSHSYVSAHYVIRSSDGQVTQMVRTKNVAFQAGNWYINTHSIGIEHEGFAAQGATWYTEALYRSSARLVRYLAQRFGIPLDRAHIIGHDNVPGIDPDHVAAMHWDPGPFWDWSHYMRLLGAPLQAGAGRTVVTIAPRFSTNVQPVQACAGDTAPPGPKEPVSFVYLRTAPSSSAPLLSDIALHPDGSPGTTQICDTGDKASTGQEFAVAGRHRGWTAIWYGGRKAWLHDTNATLATRARTVTVKPGRTSAPIYGRAYPEAAAYIGTPITPQAVVPLQYTIGAGQHYVIADRVRSTYYNSTTIHATAPGDRRVVRGDDEYYLIYFGYRMAYVKASDVAVG